MHCVCSLWHKVELTPSVATHESSGVVHPRGMQIIMRSM